MKRKTKWAVFYAKHLPSGFYAVFANGHKEFLDAALPSTDAVRAFVDKVAAASGITSYALSFDEASYKYYLEEYSKHYQKGA